MIWELLKTSRVSGAAWWSNDHGRYSISQCTNDNYIILYNSQYKTSICSRLRIQIFEWTTIVVVYNLVVTLVQLNNVMNINAYID